MRILVVVTLLLSGCIAFADTDRSELTPWEALEGEWAYEDRGTQYYDLEKSTGVRTTIMHLSSGPIEVRSEFRFAGQSPEGCCVSIEFTESGERESLSLNEDRTTMTNEKGTTFQYVGPKARP